MENININKEIWKDVQNYEGFYRISSFGKIKSLDRYVNGRFNNKQFIRGRARKLKINKYGYVQISLYKNGSDKYPYVHDLVLIAFNRFSKEDENGNIIDPCGGLNDLKYKTIRHNTNAFTEDPLRVLRVARFYAKLYHLGFKVASKTIKAIIEIVGNGELLWLTSERIWIETEKALQTKNPEKYFEFLNSVGALKIIYPEIHALIGQTHNPEFHGEGDAFDHSMLVLELMSVMTSDKVTRFAALVHDFGKGLSPKEKLPSHHGHEKTGVSVVVRMCKRLHVPNKYKELALVCTRYHIKHHLLFEMTPKKILKLLKNIDAFRKPEKFSRFIQVCIADHRGRITDGTDMINSKYLQGEFLFQCYKEVDGVDVGSLIKKEYKSRRFIQELHLLRLNAVRKVKEIWRA